jgi:hypothetical protein
MARLECRSAQAGVASAWVEVDGITDSEVAEFRAELSDRIVRKGQISDAVAAVFVELTDIAPMPIPATFGSMSFTATFCRSDGAISNGSVCPVSRSNGRWSRSISLDFSRLACGCAL